MYRALKSCTTTQGKVQAPDELFAHEDMHLPPTDKIPGAQKSRDLELDAARHVAHISPAISPSNNTTAPAAKCCERSDFTSDRIKPSSDKINSTIDMLTHEQKAALTSIGKERNALQQTSTIKGANFSLQIAEKRVSGETMCKSYRTRKTSVKNNNLNGRTPWKLVQDIRLVNHRRFPQIETE
jgi:hypothetical protein